MRRLPQLLALLGFMIWPMEIHAQSEELTEAIEEAGKLFQEERFQEAAPLLEKAIELSRKEFRTNDKRISALLNDLGYVYRHEGRHVEAEQLYKEALSIREKVLGPEHPDVATSLSNLAELYRLQGRYGEAEPLHQRALAIRKKAPDLLRPINIAISLNNLALLYEDQGRFDEAEPLYRLSLEILELAVGPDHWAVARSLTNLAELHRLQGEYDEAEPLNKRALVISEKTLGAEHPGVAAILHNLAALYRDQGRYDEAELHNRRALSIREKVLGLDHPEVAMSLANLALLYQDQGQNEEAEPLLKRALRIDEKALGAEHPEVVSILNNLATLYEDMGRYDEAEPLYKRILVIREKALSPEHPDVAISLNNLASLLHKKGRHAEAITFQSRALDIQEQALGSGHPDVATSLNNLAQFHLLQGHKAEAESLHQRALAIREKALGAEHPDVAMSLNNLAIVYWAQGRYADAIGPIRRASAIYGDRMAWSRSATSEQKTVRNIFLDHATITLSLFEEDPSQEFALAAESFEVGQLAQASSAGTAVARMSARFGTSDKSLAEIVRALQDAIEQRQRLDKTLISSLSQTPAKRDLSQESALRANLVRLDRRIVELDEQLIRDFPDYAELVTPRPLSIADARNLLTEDEALISYAVASDRTLLWVVSRSQWAVHRLDIGDEDLKSHVQGIRASLDPYTNLRPFDTRLAHELYQKLFAPAEPLLEGVNHVFLVSDLALQSLPFGILVTEEVEADFSEFPDYREVPWLIRKYAITTLPSISSLRALRQFAKASIADDPFLGVGDPVLSGHPSSAPKIELSGLFSLRGIGDVEAVRSMSSLPETAGELEALAENLKAGPDSLLLREEATEPNLRSIDLERYRVLAFATHAVVAGELKGLAEPALVLTPPIVGTEEDDGLLTASEVAALKLDADWVILSACNTAAPDGTPGAEALSGLAKAFFYAGSRALLVSHWPVSSDAAVALTTRMLSEYTPDIGRAEALRRSMRALMDDPRFAHPFYWAPFIIVGEGGVPDGRGLSLH